MLVSKKATLLVGLRNLGFNPMYHTAQDPQCEDDYIHLTNEYHVQIGQNYEYLCLCRDNNGTLEYVVETNEADIYETDGLIGDFILRMKEILK